MSKLPVARCLLCGAALVEACRPEDALCPLCRALVFPGASLPGAGHCAICHQTLLGEIDRCVDCARHSWAFTSIHGLFSYHSRSGELLRIYKGHARVVLATHWARQLAPLLIDQGVLVPVPGHRQHLRERGWDPVSLLCDALEQQTRLPILRVLRRRPTLSQKHLGGSDRVSNALKSYETLTCASRVEGQLVWLVDDVVTTGWTAEACARLLRQAGAREVRIVCLCLH